ncbi:MAG: TRAP transporter substrate-binding protein [Sporomusaceae bacterium]|nr:TRAP transporter substrate-binding protein [Sporomusaceae bacterium]
MKKKLPVLIGLVALAVSLLMAAGCSDQQQSAGKDGKAAVKTLKIGMVTNKDRSLSKGTVKFGELVEKHTNGSIKVEVFTDGVLGGDRQVIEALQMGTVQATAVSTGVVAAFAPRFDAFDLPFLFKDKPTAYKVFDGPIGKEVLQDLPAAKLVGLAYWENGFRHLTNNKRDVKTAADIAGLKIRTLESKVHVEGWKTLGANPTPMSFSQLYSGLEQHVIDGQENPYGNVVASKFYEVQKYLTNTAHVYNANVFMVSKVFWDTLSDSEKQAVEKAAEEAKVYQRQLNEQEDQDSVAYLKTKGMTISDLNPGEREKMVEMMQPLYKSVSASLGGDLVERLLQAAK